MSRNKTEAPKAETPAEMMDRIDREFAQVSRMMRQVLVKPPGSDEDRNAMLAASFALWFASAGLIQRSFVLLGATAPQAGDAQRH